MSSYPEDLVDVPPVLLGRTPLSCHSLFLVGQVVGWLSEKFDITFVIDASSSSTLRSKSNL